MASTESIDEAAAWIEKIRGSYQRYKQQKTIPLACKQQPIRFQEYSCTRQKQPTCHSFPIALSTGSITLKCAFRSKLIASPQRMTRFGMTPKQSLTGLRRKGLRQPQFFYHLVRDFQRYFIDIGIGNAI